jgi:hypothetical protein
MALWVPPRVSKELLEERLLFEQMAALMFEVERDAVCDELNRQLEPIDPNVQIVRAKPTVRTGFPIKPGFYHFVRHNPGAPLSITPITGPNDEYVVPGSQVVDMLRERDLQNPQVRRDMERREEERQARLEAEKQQMRDEIDTEVTERVLAATRTQVSLNRDSAWSQNANGRRGVAR